MNMDYQAIGRRVREGRRAMKLTQEQLAERLELSYSYIGHIERGSRKASIETLSSVCDELRMSMDQVLGRDLMSKKTRDDFARELLTRTYQMVDGWMESDTARVIRRQPEP